MKFLYLLCLFSISAFAGPGTSGGTPGALRFTMTADRTRALFGDVLFDALTGDPIGRPMWEIGIGSSALSPDGTRAVSARWLDNGSPEDQFTTLWNVDTGERIADLPQGELPTEEFFTPDGRKLITVSSGHALVWDSRTGAPLATLRPVPPAGPDPYYCYSEFHGVKVTPDSRYAFLTCGRTENWLTIIDLDTYQVVPNKALLGEDFESGIEPFSFLPNSNLLVTKSRGYVGEAEAAVYDYAKHRLLYKVDKGVASLSESQDGHILITRRYQEKRLSYWDSATGRLLRTVDLSALPLQNLDTVGVGANQDASKLDLFVVQEEHSSPYVPYEEKEFLLDVASGRIHDISPLAFSYGGGYFEEGYVTLERLWGGHAAFVHSWDDGHVIRTFVPQNPTEIFVSSDRRILVPVSLEIHGDPARQPVHVFDFASGKLLHTIYGDGGESLRAVSISSNGRYALLSTHDFNMEGPGTLYLWDLIDGRKIRRFDGDWSTGDGTTFSADGSLALTFSPDKKELRVWRSATGEPVRSLKLKDTGFSARFRGQGAEVLVDYFWSDSSHYDYHMANFDPLAGAVKFDVVSEYGEDRFSVLPDGSAYWYMHTQQARLFDAGTGVSLFNALVGPGYCMPTPDSKKLYCLAAYQVRVYDVASHQQTAFHEFLDGFKSPASFSGFSPEGDMVQIADRILDPNTFERVCPTPKLAFTLFGHGELLEYSYSRRDLSVNDCRTGAELKSLRIY